MAEIFRHFKGGRYLRLLDAKHSETKEDLVVYVSLDYGTTWVRPAPMWAEVTDRWPDKISRPRFVLESELPRNVLDAFLGKGGTTG
mgnify:FL=1